MNLYNLREKQIYLMPIDVISLSICVILQSEGCTICGVLDNNTAVHGKKIKGIVISSPTVVNYSNEDSLIIISNHQSAIPPEFETKESSVIDLSLGADKHTIKKHLNSKKAMGACYVCSGKARGNVDQIIAAKQTKKYSNIKDI